MSIRMRMVSICLPVAIILVSFLSLVVWSRHSDRFPLRTVEIRSPLHLVKEAEVQASVLPFFDKGFFWLNVKAVQACLKRIPWVQAADVKRVWPDRLLVSVQEKTAQAKWGEKGVLSTDGVIFYPEVATIPQKLPQFDGPTSEALVMQQHYFALLEQLGAVGLTIQSLNLSLNGALKIMLDNGISIILGKNAINERMARFVLAYQANLQAQSQRIAYVDLRYTNGFAIGWKAAGVQ
jgi:cell division protein FtsQ